MLWRACIGLCSEEYSRKSRVSQEIWQHPCRLSLARLFSIAAEGEQGSFDIKALNAETTLGPALFGDFVFTLARGLAGPT